MAVARGTPTGPGAFRQSDVTATLSDGTQVIVRALTPDDRELLAEGMRRLSATSRYQRFHAAIDTLSDDQLRYLTEIDQHDHAAVVAVTHDRSARGVGVARYVRIPDTPDCAEIAVTVLDEFHRLGVAKLLLGALLPRARSAGIERLTCRVLADNHVVLRWFTHRGARLRRASRWLVQVEVTIDELEHAIHQDHQPETWPDDALDRWLAEPDSR